MAKTIDDLRTDTRTYLDEVTEADFLDTQVDSAINRSFHHVVQKVIEIYDDWYDDVSVSPFSYAIVAGKQEYVIDSSIIKPTRVEIDFSATGTESNATRCVPIKRDEVRGNLGNTNNAGSFFSAGYYIRGLQGAQKIGFVPVPQIADTGSNKSIFVWGIILPADLSDSNSTVNIPYVDNFYQIISKRAAGILLRKGQQEEATAARYLVETDNELVDMQTFLKDRQSDDGQYIEDSALEQIDFSTLEII